MFNLRNIHLTASIILTREENQIFMYNIAILFYLQKA
jgi:hypothetical protein